MAVAVVLLAVLLAVALVVIVILSRRLADGRADLAAVRAQAMAETAEQSVAAANEIEAVRAEAAVGASEAAEREAQLRTAADVLVIERDQLVAELRSADDAASQTQQRLVTELEGTRSVALEAEAEATEATARADAALAEAEARRVELEGLRAEIRGRQVEADALRGEGDGLRDDVARLEAELADARERAHPVESTPDDDRAAAVAAGDGGAPASVDALWALELNRSERKWRHSVAVGPQDHGPFGAEDDPLRAAIGIEVDAAREEAGIDVAVVWQLEEVLDRATSLLVLRAVQELLGASIAVVEEATVLNVASDGGGVLLSLAHATGEALDLGDALDAMRAPGVDPTTGGLRVSRTTP